MSKITFVMYHYVRKIKHSKYPDIKGLEISLFKQQLAYFQKHYTIIKMEDLFENITGAKELPNNSLILTFDDAYKDHFEYVFPILQELQLQGSFFPPAKAITKHQVLDVNKIHFILASVKDKKKIISDIFHYIEKYRKDFGLKTTKFYYSKLAKPSKYDTEEVVFIKKILQKELPEKVRQTINNALFNKHVTTNEQSFSQELYMTIDQLKLMKRKGMYIGSHGYDHYWLNTITEQQQKQEITNSVKFLKTICGDIKEWVMCYPYGAYNNTLLTLLKKHGCKVGLTTQTGIADINNDNPLTLPRLDTNDLPKDAHAPPNTWTQQVTNLKKEIMQPSMT